MLIATGQSFRLGKVIGLGTSILSRNLITFGVISLIVTLPSLLYELWTGTAVVTTTTEVTDSGFHAARSISGAALIPFALQLILGQVAVGAISYGAFRELQGQRANLAECLSRAVSLFLLVLGVAVVTGLAVLIGTLLLVIPGLILATMLWVAVPVAAVERPGVLQSLSRSSALTKGHRWQILGIILLIGLGSLVVGYVAAAIFGSGTWSALIKWIIAALISSVTASITAVSYATLRFAKEGIGIEQIARVFD